MSALSDLRIRRAQDSDTSVIVRLLRDELGEESTQKTEAFWKWKHVSNPFGRSACIIAETEGGIVGVRAFMRWQLSAESGEYSVVRAVDTVTHRAWRGMGVFGLLTMQLVRELSHEGVGFVFNCPNAISHRGYLKMGWDDIGRVAVRARPIGFPNLAGILTSSTHRSDPWLNSNSDIFRAMSEMSGDSALVGFVCNNPRLTQRLTTVKSLDYLTWRYGDIPGLEYRAVWHVSGNDGALLICRVKGHRRFSELRLVEIIIGSGRASQTIARDLTAQVLKSGVADVVTASATGGRQERHLLNRFCFVPIRNAGPTVVARELALPAPKSIGDFQSSLGDFEIF